MTWIHTAHGRAVDLLDPQPDTIDLRDIAHALDRICRYTGHCSEHYSVAAHSLNVAAYCREIGCDNVTYRAALLHDATEAYLGDVASPLKSLLPEYKAIEARFWTVIARKFGLPDPLPDMVKAADRVMLISEAPALLPWPPPREWGDWFTKESAWPRWQQRYVMGAFVRECERVSV